MEVETEYLNPPMPLGIHIPVLRGTGRCSRETNFLLPSRYPGFGIAAALSPLTRFADHRRRGN